MEPPAASTRHTRTLTAAAACLLVLGGVFAFLFSQRPSTPPLEGAPPIVVGLSTNHALSERQIGALLIGELGCASCHPQLQSAYHKAAPDLTDVGARIAPEFLQRFIAEPQAVQPGTTMPHALHHLPEDERTRVAEAITHFLVASSAAPPTAPIEDDPPHRARGRDLFHSIGCVACHAPREPPATVGAAPTRAAPTWLEGVISLDHIADKYSTQSLAQFLHDPLHTRPSGRMPDMRLTSSESRDIAAYLIADVAHAPLATNPSLAASGETYFKTHNCAACHHLDGVHARPDTPNTLDPTKGCLSTHPGAAPGYPLSHDQRQAIRAALTPTDLSPDDHIALTLTAFNCLACHTRDDRGGVRQALDPYFTTTEPSLGDEARIPPTLTHVGAKLTQDWLHRVLFDGATVRPYMATRMPQFGEANLHDFPELAEAADAPEPFDFPHLDHETANKAREAGRLLVGTDSLGCVTCHDFNGKPSPSFRGVDLITSTTRLRPAWFADFLKSPQTARPGIVMPESWPGGESVRPDVLGGDADAQIHSIWSFLAQGRTARDPAGIRAEPTILTVSDTARTYRGRSRVAGFRGIAVGFPSGLNYAFNAETGAIAAIWRGGFVRVRWDGQGAGDFHPEGRPIDLPQDVGVCRLPDIDASWPLRPHMDEDNPVNPDPLYPRNRGYRFEGYVLDDDDIPTFMYRSNDVAIKDTTRLAPDGAALIRTISLTPTSDELFLRILTGEIEQLAPNRFRRDGLTVTTPPHTALIRQAEDKLELLLRIEPTLNETTLTISYEPPP